MKSKIFVGLLTAITVLLGLFGIVNRVSYTDVTSQEDYLSSFLVAEIPSEFAQAQIKVLKDELPLCQYIFSAKPIGELESMFNTCRQKVYIKRVYKGEILPGDEIYITSRRWSINIEGDERVISRGFVNIPQADREYLVFCNEKISAKGSIPVYKICEHSYITPIFCYDEIKNVIVPIDENADSTYVPYILVKDNEFFAGDKEASDVWLDLKKSMLNLYS